MGMHTNRFRQIMTALLLGACVWGCGPTWSVKPHEKAKYVMHLRSGLFSIPKEYDDGFSSFGLMTGGSIGLGYGLSKQLSPWAAVYPLWMFQGTPYAEAGLLTGIITPENSGFGLSVNTHIHLSSRFVIPQVDINVYCESHRLRPYVGAAYYEPMWLREDSVGNLYAPSLNTGLVYKADGAEVGIDLRFPIRRLFKVGSNPNVGQFGLGFSVVPRWSPFDKD